MKKVDCFSRKDFINSLIVEKVINLLVIMNQSEIVLDVDVVIQQLLAVRNQKPGKVVNLPENTIIGLVQTVREIFLN